MKREKLETYIGRQVKVLLFDGRAYEGCLQKTNTDAVKHNPNLYLKHNYYALLDKGGNTMGPIFRCSHVTRVKEVADAGT